MAAAPERVRDVRLYNLFQDEWPEAEAQLAAGCPDPLLPAGVLRTFMTALAPADGVRLEVFGERSARYLAEAASPAPPLRVVGLRLGGRPRPDDCARLAAAWPGLRGLELPFDPTLDDARELARFGALEELALRCRSRGQVRGLAAALSRDLVRLRVHGGHLGPEDAAAVADRCPALERLEASFDARSAGAVRRLGRLRGLVRLRLTLDVAGPAERGRRLLEAAAAALSELSPRLEELDLDMRSFQPWWGAHVDGVPLDAAAAVAVARAARSALRALYVADYCPATLVELARVRAPLPFFEGERGRDDSRRRRRGRTRRRRVPWGSACRSRRAGAWKTSRRCTPSARRRARGRR